MLSKIVCLFQFQWLSRFWHPKKINKIKIKEKTYAIHLFCIKRHISCFLFTTWPICWYLLQFQQLPSVMIAITIRLVLKNSLYRNHVMDSWNACLQIIYLYRCSICLGDYEEKEMLRVIPTCHHNFHLVCIDLWLQKQSTCPICRLPLKDLFDGKCATASSPTALAPQTNSTIVDTPTWDRSTNQLITNAVSGDPVQVVVTST